MRILHVTDRSIPPKPSEGGAPHSLDALRLAQLAQGDEPIIASTVRNSLPNSVDLHNNKCAGSRLLDAVREKDVDIVHFHAGGKQLQPLLNEQGVPSVVHIRGLRRPDAVALHNVIYVSRAHADYHRGSVYVHNGIDLSQYPFCESPEEALAFLGKVKRSKKGADLAVDVAKALGISLWLMGGGKFSLPCTWLPVNRLIRPLGVVGHEKKVQHLGASKGLLFPIRWDEPFGLVLIEAMACGTPVIAFNRGAVNEIIKNGETGFIVDTPQQMCSTVSRLDDIDRVACRRHVEDHFSINQTANELKSLYARVLEGDGW